MITLLLTLLFLNATVFNFQSKIGLSGIHIDDNRVEMISIFIVENEKWILDALTKSFNDVCEDIFSFSRSPSRSVTNVV